MWVGPRCGVRASAAAAAAAPAPMHSLQPAAAAAAVAANTQAGRLPLAKHQASLKDPAKTQRGAPVIRGRTSWLRSCACTPIRLEPAEAVMRPPAIDMAAAARSLLCYLSRRCKQRGRAAVSSGSRQRQRRRQPGCGRARLVAAQVQTTSPAPISSQGVRQPGWAHDAAPRPAAVSLGGLFGRRVELMSAAAAGDPASSEWRVDGAPQGLAAEHCSSGGSAQGGTGPQCRSQCRWTTGPLSWHLPAACKRLQPGANIHHCSWRPGNCIVPLTTVSRICV